MTATLEQAAPKPQAALEPQISKRRLAYFAWPALGLLLPAVMPAYVISLRAGLGLGWMLVVAARALVPRPRVLLLDEPFSALDAFTRAYLREHLFDLWADLKPTLVMVTHDVEEAVVLADRVMVMRPHPGRMFVENICNLPRPRDRQSAAFDFAKRRVLAALDRSLQRTKITDDREARAAQGGGLWW
jgi:translation initiation factor RLI1